MRVKDADTPQRLGSVITTLEWTKVDKTVHGEKMCEVTFDSALAQVKYSSIE